MWSVGLLIGLLGGAGATIVAQRFFIKSKSQEIIKNAEIEAENIRKERALQSKEKFLKQKEEHDESIREREKRMQSNEDRYRAKEKTLDQKLEELKSIYPQLRAIGAAGGRWSNTFSDQVIQGIRESELL